MKLPRPILQLEQGTLGFGLISVLWLFTHDCEEAGADAGPAETEAPGGFGVDGQAGAEADEVLDQVGVAADEAELAAKFLSSIGHVARTPSPSRCGRLAYKSCQIMRMWTLPNIKFVFLKDLSLNSSSDWSYGRSAASQRVGQNTQATDAVACVLLESVTGTVSIFRVANCRV